MYNAPLMIPADPAALKTPLAPPDPGRVMETVRTRLSVPCTFKKLSPLAGDASNRRYFRIDVNESPPGSLILMQLAEPEAFKQSEEAVSGALHQSAELPFLSVRTPLAAAGVPVPALYYYDRAAGCFYLEDSGIHPGGSLPGRQPGPIEASYKQAIDVLLKQIQLRATAPIEFSCVAFHRGFDAPLLMWSSITFRTESSSPRQADARPGIRAIPSKNFRRSPNNWPGHPRVRHRDYHSRNLMVDGERLGVIDFQTRHGPATYDLASYCATRISRSTKR